MAEMRSAIRGQGRARIWLSFGPFVVATAMMGVLLSSNALAHDARRGAELIENLLPRGTAGNFVFGWAVKHDQPIALVNRSPLQQVNPPRVSTNRATSSTPMP